MSQEQADSGVVGPSSASTLAVRSVPVSLSGVFSRIAPVPRLWGRRETLFDLLIVDAVRVWERIMPIRERRLTVSAIAVMPRPLAADRSCGMVRFPTETRLESRSIQPSKADASERIGVGSLRRPC